MLPPNLHSVQSAGRWSVQMWFGSVSFCPRTVVEVNIAPSELTYDLVDIFQAGRAGEALPRLVALVERLRAERGSD